MENRHYFFLLLLLCTFMPGLAWAQEATIKGSVLDNNGTPMIGANVFLEGTSIGSQTDLSGLYSFKAAEGSYVLVVSYIGYTTQRQNIEAKGEISIDFILKEDQLGLDEVIVTGVFNEKTKLESSVAITSLRPALIAQRLPRGVGDLLNAVPGTYVDNAGGEVGNRVYARGMASGTVDDTGFRYVSLQEDGLPVMSSLVQFASADMFSRADVNVDRLEAIRGGSSAITAPNAPGGVYNFISKEGGNKFGGTAIMKMGINGRDNIYSRFDMGLGGPMGADDGWTYYVGGFYRYDEGARDLPFVANQGGQIKANIVKTHGTGKIKLYGKFLNDRVTHYRPLPFKNFETLEPFGDALQNFDLNYSSTFSDVQAYLPDYSYGKRIGELRDFDSRKGIDIMHYMAGLSIEQDLGEWTLANNMKYSRADQRYLQYVGNIVAPIEFAMAGLGYGPPLFSNSQFRYYDARTGELLYSQADGVNKMGNNIFGTIPLDMNNQISDFMNQFTISRKAGKHSLVFGSFQSSSKLVSTWHADIMLGTLEPNSRPVRVTHPNPFAGVPGAPSVFQITNDMGFAAVNSVTMLGFEGTSNMISAFANDVWSASERLTIDFGMRYDRLHQTGFKRGWGTSTKVFDAMAGYGAPVFLPTGFDGNYGTFYDAITRKHNENKFEYDETYQTLSFSLGANLKLDDKKAIFARLSKGNKAPDHEWYISNFENTPINRGVVEKVYQAEAGLKLRSDKASLFLTGFYSFLDDITYQAFIVSSNTTFFTPATFNKARTLGLEVEATANPFKNFDLRFLATLQDPRYVQFALYNTNGTSPRFGRDGDGQTIVLNPLLPNGTPITFPETPPAGANGATTSDDYYEDMSGNRVNDIPSVILDLTASYRIKSAGVFVNARYTGEYAYNKRNDFNMPAYTVINGGLFWMVSKKMELSLNMNNVFNTIGVTRTEGAALLDGNKEFFTKEFLENHANNAFGIPGRQGSVWAVPILPRMTTITATYNF